MGEDDRRHRVGRCGAVAVGNRDGIAILVHLHAIFEITQGLLLILLPRETRWLRMSPADGDGGVTDFVWGGRTSTPLVEAPSEGGVSIRLLNQV